MIQGDFWILSWGLRFSICHTGIAIFSNSQSRFYIKALVAEKANFEKKVTARNLREVLWDSSNGHQRRFDQIPFNFCSKNRSRVKILRWPTFFSLKILRYLKIRINFASNSISLRILSHLRILEPKKVGHPIILTRDRYFEPSQKHKHIPSCDKSPSFTAWVISKYLLYFLTSQFWTHRTIFFKCSWKIQKF